MKTQPTHPNDQPEGSALGDLFRSHLDELELRLAHALEATGHGGLVIFAGSPPLPARDDQPYPFRAEPFFVQWCPLTDVPDAALVLEPGRKPQLLFPRRADFWHVPPADPSGYWCEAFDIEPFTTNAERDRMLGRLGSGFASIGAPLPGATNGGGTTGATRGRGASAAGAEPRALIAALSYDRARKTDYEIACIARANRIAVEGHRMIAREFAAGRGEFELNLAYLAATRQSDIDLPYPNIVAINEHAGVLHYQHLDREAPDESRLLLVDAGARCAGYAADVTRTTVAVGNGARSSESVQRADASNRAAPVAGTAAGEPTSRFVGDLVAAVDAMQQTLAAAVAAGIDFVELNETAHQRLGVVLADHGLVTCGADEAFATGLTRLFLPHGLGHLLGLQVHDVGGWQDGPDGSERRPPEAHPFLRLTRRLEPGFVVTIEPGLYVIDSLLETASTAARRRLGTAAINALRPYGGIRVEDDVVAKAGDNTNLTRAAFSMLEGT